MTEAESLAKAYFIFGLEPGAAPEVIKRRYKRLIMVWHPDRFPTADGRKDAEEELKRINDANDKLQTHFEKNHKASGPCACRSTATASDGASSARPNQGAGPGPGKRRTTQENNREEAEAKRKSDERARRAAEEATAKTAQSKAAAAEAATKQAAQQSVDQAKTMDDERLRWKVAACMGLAWIALSLFGFTGTGIKGWWHDVSRQWERDHPAASTSNSNTNTSSPSFSTGPTKTAAPAYIPAYNQTPGGKATTWQNQQDAAQKRRDDEAKKQKDQDIYFTKLDIDKYTKQIATCTSTIADLEAQIANPAVSDYEKNKLITYQTQQRNYLGGFQTNLNMANKRLADLTGTQAPPPIDTKANTLPLPSVAGQTDLRQRANAFLGSGANPVIGSPRPVPNLNAPAVAPTGTSIPSSPGLSGLFSRRTMDQINQQLGK
jgi:curved DNA-binding protein CbpA